MRNVPTQPGRFLCRYSGKRYDTSDLAELTDKKYFPLSKSMLSNFHHCSKCDGYSEGRCTCQSKPTTPDLLNWNSSVPYTPYKDASQPCVGLEIEMGAGTASWSTRKYIKKIHDLPYIIFKYDGSIRGSVVNGDAAIEIVTLPINVGELDNLELWKLMPDISKHGGTSRLTDTCGNHIHLSKTMFSNKGLYNYLLFHREYFPLITLISGRSQARINRWADPSPLLGSSNGVLEKIANDMYSSWNRHSLVSLQHSKSIEMRYFAGSVNPEILLRNVEFCVSLAQYCNQEAEASRAITDDAYIQYLKDHKEDYPRIESFFSDPLLLVEE